MPQKMYYSEQEAAEKLGVGIDVLANLAREGKLQQFQDGAKKVYQSAKVDELATTMNPDIQPLGMDDTGEIELSPTETGIGDALSLSETEAPIEPGKDDTVITADGISIFDDEDLEIEAADPMAKTQIAPSLEDQISLEGVGSGSGLLDLTRESDDTSLGADVLGHIDMESGIAPSLDATDVEAPAPLTEMGVEPAVVIEQPVIIEDDDPGAGLFNGLVVGSSLIAMVLAAVMFSAMREQSAVFVELLKNNILVAVGGMAVVLVACGVVGLMLGKSTSARQAIQQAGG